MSFSAPQKRIELQDLLNAKIPSQFSKMGAVKELVQNHIGT